MNENVFPGRNSPESQERDLLRRQGKILPWSSANIKKGRALSLHLASATLVSPPSLLNRPQHDVLGIDPVAAGFEVKLVPMFESVTRRSGSVEHEAVNEAPVDARLLKDQRRLDHDPVSGLGRQRRKKVRLLKGQLDRRAG